MVIQVMGLIKVLGSVRRKRVASQFMDKEANDNKQLSTLSEAMFFNVFCIQWVSRFAKRQA